MSKWAQRKANQSRQDVPTADGDLRSPMKIAYNIYGVSNKSWNGLGLKNLNMFKKIFNFIKLSLHFCMILITVFLIWAKTLGKLYYSDNHRSGTQTQARESYVSYPQNTF